jgi:peptide/nickel transport system permease protein
VAENSTEGTIERKRRSGLVDVLIRLVKEKPLGTVGLVITMLLLLTGIFANFIAPHGLNVSNMQNILAPPSIHFWLGTDNLGRDLLSRVIFGARISVIVGLAATSLGTVISTFIGVVSGYFGGTLDLIVQRFVDAVICIPMLMLVMIVMSMVGPGMVQLIIVLGIYGGINTSRVIRSAVIGIKENVYLQASKAIGCSNTGILTRHILPNIMAPLIVGFTTYLPGVILTEASLSFLGYGIPPPAPSWGGMLSATGLEYMYLSPWMVVWPGLALTVTVYGVNIFGDALRDILDPRLRGGIGRYGVKVKKKVVKVPQISTDR